MTQRPSPILRSNRQQQPAPGRTGCAALRTRANLAAMLAMCRTRNAIRCEMPPANIAQQDATRSAETKVPSTATAQSP